MWKAPDIDYMVSTFNTLKPRQNGHHFPEDILKRSFLIENAYIFIKVSLKFF